MAITVVGSGTQNDPITSITGILPFGTDLNGLYIMDGATINILHKDNKNCFTGATVGSGLTVNSDGDISGTLTATYGKNLVITTKVVGIPAQITMHMAVPNYTVSFAAVNGSWDDSTSVSVPKGSRYAWGDGQGTLSLAIIYPDDSTQIGRTTTPTGSYSFYYMNSSIDGVMDPLEPYFVTGNVTITANYTATRTVYIQTYTSSTSTINSFSIAQGSTWSQAYGTNRIDFSNGYSASPPSITGYTFSYWSQPSGTVGSSNVYLVAYYTKNTYTITFATDGNGSTYPSSVTAGYGDTYAYYPQQNVIRFSNGTTVSTTPNYGYQFSSWSGISSPVTGAHTVTAYFTKIEVTSLSISPSSKTLGKNGTATFTAVVSPSGASNNCTWSVSPSGIVTLDTSSGGTVTVTAGTTTGSVTLTATSTVTSSKTATATITVQNNHVYTISYDANGGTGAPSGESHTTTSETSYNFTVSNTVPTRTGYTFVGWNTSPNGGGTYYTAGNTVTATENSPDVVLFAIWSTSPDVPTYTETNLPKAAVRIYKSPSAYVDMTYKMTVQPTIYKAVNRAGQFSFTVTNNPDNSFLSDEYDGWSDGSTGAVEWGMYCIVESINASGTTTYLTDGYVTTMEVNEYSLTFQCADHLAILGSRGADIHRNYYDSRTANVIQDVEREQYSGTAPSYVRTDITEIASAEGSVDSNTVKYKISTTDSIGTSSSTEAILVVDKVYHGVHSYVAYPVTWTHNFNKDFSSITLRINKGVGKTSLVMTVDGITATWSANDAGGNKNIVMDFGQVILGGEHTVTITGSGTNTADCSLYLSGGTYNDPIHYYYESSISHGTIIERDTTGMVYCPSITEYDDATVNTFTVETIGARTYMKITDIQGVTINTDYDMLTIPTEGRVKFSYISGTVSAGEIITNISSRSGYIPLIATVPDMPELKLFRSGGGYALDYLQKVADIDRALTFTAKGYVPVLNVGGRRSSTVSPLYTCAYGNSDAVGNDLLMYSFRPKKSMTNRPSRAMIRTAISNKGTDSTPVIALVYNDRLLTSRNGIGTDTVVANSSVLSVFDAVRSAYISVNHDEEDWEGSLTISGIVPDMIDVEGACAGSGTVISITDSRYGFNDKSFVITDVTYDFEQITTTVTLTNAPQVYSSAIAESIATAYSAADLVVGDSESTAYNTQYVSAQKSGITVYTTGNTMKIVNSNGEITMDNVTAYVMDGHTLVYGSKTIENSDNPSTAKYDVHTIIVNGVSITIPEKSRPDCYEGQTIIVNVDVFN